MSDMAKVAVDLDNHARKSIRLAAEAIIEATDDSPTRANVKIGAAARVISSGVRLLSMSSTLSTLEWQMDRLQNVMLDRR